MDGNFYWFFFVMNGIDIHQLDLGLFKILEFSIENPFKKCVFSHLFNNECTIKRIMKKILQYERGWDFITRLWINFELIFIW